MWLLTAQHFHSLWDSIFAYLEIIYFTIKDTKPWKFLKIMFRKKNIGCFISFSTNISKSKIHIFGHQIQHDWLAGMHLRHSSYTVWLLYLEHIDSINIYKNKYCVHKWLLKRLFKKNSIMVHWQKTSQHCCTLTLPCKWKPALFLMIRVSLIYLVNHSNG